MPEKMIINEVVPPFLLQIDNYFSNWLIVDGYPGSLCIVMVAAVGHFWNIDTVGSDACNEIDKTNGRKIDWQLHHSHTSAIVELK